MKQDYPIEGYEVFRATVRKMAEIAKQNNIELITVFIPSKQQLMLQTENKRPFFVNRGAKLSSELPVKRLSKILVEYGIPIKQQIDLLPYFAKQNWRELYFTHDAHINEKGNRYVAAILSGVAPETQAVRY